MKTLLIILFMLTGALLHAQDAALSVVSNPKGSPSQMNLSELKSVFRGENQYWSNGQRVVLALMKASTEIGKNICERVYHLSPDEFNKYWLKIVFQGKSDPPVFFNTVTELLDFVRQNPGAIGIIDQSQPAADVKVVLIEGKKTF